jgi:MinD superfamily P-loop ATPase
MPYESSKRMIIAIASGKGGTGKTTIATNLALSTATQPTSQPVWLLDCDVEAPNDALFLHPVFTSEKTSTRLLPVFDSEACNGCGKCTQVCTYNAIAVVNNQALFFKDLCHACGSCTLICPQKAIHDEAETIGWLQSGQAGMLNFAQGTLQIGFSSPVPVIRDLKQWIFPTNPQEVPAFLDAAPSCTCSVVETLRGADFALLVTEPTPFGLHDLKLVVELVKNKFELPCGVVINKSGANDSIIEAFCQAQDVPILMRLPLSRRIAEICAGGELLVEALPEYQADFRQLYNRIHNILQQKQEVET